MLIICLQEVTWVIPDLHVCRLAPELIQHDRDTKYIRKHDTRIYSQEYFQSNRQKNTPEYLVHRKNNILTKESTVFRKYWTGKNNACLSADLRCWPSRLSVVWVMIIITSPQRKYRWIMIHGCTISKHFIFLVPYFGHENAWSDLDSIFL